MTELERRVAKLEAAEEIKRLKYRHIQLTDTGYPVDELVDLWTEDGVWAGLTTEVDERWTSAPGTGEFAGREGIRKFWELNRDQYDWTLHAIYAPDIEVAEDVQSATGNWHFLMPCTRKVEDGSLAPIWVGGFHHDAYRRVDGRWLFHRVAVEVTLMAEHHAGWHPERFIADAPVRAGTTAPSAT